MFEAFTRRSRRIVRLAWPILILALVVPAAAKPHNHNGKGKEYKEYKQKGSKGKQESVRVVFVPVHRQKIREYFIVHQTSLPRYYYSDLDELPPGIQRQLIVGRPLPPGLAKRMYPFPPSLDEVLGPPPPCCDRVIIGRNGYLVDRTTNLILDILSNLIFR